MCVKLRLMVGKATGSSGLYVQPVTGRRNELRKDKQKRRLMSNAPGDRLKKRWLLGESMIKTDNKGATRRGLSSLLVLTMEAIAPAPGIRGVGSMILH